MSLRIWSLLVAMVFLCGIAGKVDAQDREKEKLFKDPIRVEVPHFKTDPKVKLDYDIVYVRAPRAGDKVHKRFYTDIATPVTLEPGADLMLLHPDGSEELLVKGGDGSITDPVISFDAKWCYYTHIHSLKNAGQWQPPLGADIFKINLTSKKIVRLTNQKFDPNLGAADWSADFRTGGKDNKQTHLSYGVLNFGAYPLPGKKFVYTSNRNAFVPSKGYPRIALQLFIADDRDESISDDDDTNIEKIGHLNLAGALHPVVLTDGRIIFSSLESQGIRGDILWGIWSIHPDGSNWGPVVSAFDPGGAPNAFHFQSQLSDGTIIVEAYYNQNNSGFGTFVKIPLSPPDGYAQFGPGSMRDPRNKPWRIGREDNGRPHYYRMPFMPTGSEMLTPFTHMHDGPADKSIPGDKDSPRVGKFTHPSGAPDNHLLCIYSPGPANHQYTYLPQLDGGIYLIKDGKPIDEPAQMLLIKNDPNYNESWPRAVVSYQRIYGIPEPKRLAPVKNDGKLSPHLPEGTPFGLVGTSSLYKRESYPNGVVPEGKVTATFDGAHQNPWKGLDAFTSHGNGMPLNWHNQGAEAGLYDNSQIHAIRILAMEPTTDRNRGANSGRRFFNHAHERLRILGEIPVRKFGQSSERGQIDGQPLDPDGNPDTSFLAKIPADTAFTFQTIDKEGMVLNMSQTWHQLRPGEIRTNCGGCHAHSQKPTLFEDTLAAKPNYKVWDLTTTTPLVTTLDKNEVKMQFDEKGHSGLKLAKSGVVNVEYLRDIKPLLQKSCIGCHTAREGREPAAKLNLDADDEMVQIENVGKFPGTYARLALDERGKFGIKPVGYDSWGYPQASRYIRKMQSRRSLLIWKINGHRTDGFTNDDFPSESPPGSGKILQKGNEVSLEKVKSQVDLDYVGGHMPPYNTSLKDHPKNRDGSRWKFEALTREDRMTIARWIDLGCPIDLDYDAENPERRGQGWAGDDNRPTLTLNSPVEGRSPSLDRILIGMHDYYTGLDPTTFSVTADFAIDGIVARQNLASKFREVNPGVWEFKLAAPIRSLPSGKVTVSIADKQGNVSRIVRSIQVSPEVAHGGEKPQNAKPKLRQGFIIDEF